MHASLFLLRMGQAGKISGKYKIKWDLVVMEACHLQGLEDKSGSSSRFVNFTMEKLNIVEFKAYYICEGTKATPSKGSP